MRRRDERGLRQLADRLAEAEELRKKRAAATREIAAAIGKHGSEADFAPFLAPDTIGRLEGDWESLSTQVETIDKQLKELLQQRGALVEQQRTAAADQSLAKKQLDLDIVSAQIVEKVEAWRERAAVGILLDEIRDEYEKFRQPETLREASIYMAKLTSGKYTRIWTPLANDILLVDTEDGKALPVEVLSRGTREQLFVSLRLALVAAFARRGIHLPMILDDVFVNFDAGRTKIAVSVLREFAREGHQLLVFTCHEHVWRMFAEVKADTRRIPNRYNKNEEIIEPEFEPEPEPVAELPAPEPEPIVEAESEVDRTDARARTSGRRVRRRGDHGVRPVPVAAPRRSGILLARLAAERKERQGRHKRSTPCRDADPVAPPLARRADDPSARLVVVRSRRAFSRQQVRIGSLRLDWTEHPSASASKDLFIVGPREASWCRQFKKTTEPFNFGDTSATGD